MPIYSVRNPEVLAVLVEDEQTMVLFCDVDLLESNSPPPGHFLLGPFCITSSDTDS